MSPDEPQATTEERRRARLAASLRENLKRRKAQSRARAIESAPSEGLTPRTPGEFGELTAGSIGRQRSDRIWARGTRGWIGYKFAAARR